MVRNRLAPSRQVTAAQHLPITERTHLSKTDGFISRVPADMSRFLESRLKPTVIKLQAILRMSSATDPEENEKMAENVKRLLAVALIAVAPIAVYAQDADQATKEALDELDQMSVEVDEFVGDVRFDEGDVKILNDLWDEYSEFGEDEYEPDDNIDFESMLDDDRYSGWAASHSLDAEDWARKTVRITMVLYREQMLEAAKMMPEQMAQQLAMLEE